MASEAYYIAPEVAAQRRERRLFALDFIAALKADDVEEAAKVFADKLLSSGDLDKTFHQIARSGVAASERFRSGFLEFFMSFGDSLRSEVNDDLALLDVLRLLLPRYLGPPMILFRGQQALSSRERSYGTSWSESKEVADAYAQTGLCRASKSGSVLLRTQAPTQAIICAICDHADDRYHEKEFIVDRRRLAKVNVLERYPRQERFR